MGTLSVQIKVLQGHRPILFVCGSHGNECSEGYLITCPCQGHDLDKKQLEGSSGEENWSNRFSQAMAFAELLSINRETGELKVVDRDVDRIDFQDVRIEEEEEVVEPPRGDEDFENNLPEDVQVTSGKGTKKNQSMKECRISNEVSCSSEENIEQQGENIQLGIVSSEEEHRAPVSISETLEVSLHDKTSCSQHGSALQVVTVGDSMKRDHLNLTVDERSLLDVLGSFVEIDQGGTQSHLVAAENIDPETPVNVTITPEEYSSLPKSTRIREYEQHQVTQFLQKYKNYSSGKNVALCEYCGAAFRNMTAYKNHIKVVHTTEERQKNIICEICGKKFSLQRSLKDHQNSAHSAKSFECRTCGKVYKHKRTLFLHEDTHGNSEVEGQVEGKVENNLDLSAAEFAATVGNNDRAGLGSEQKAEGVNFIVDDTLGKRKDNDALCDDQTTDVMNSEPTIATVKRAPKKYVICKLCGKEYISRYMAQHMLSHSGKMISCEICGKLVRELSMKTHMRIHNCPKQFPCEFCDFKFRTANLLKKHILTHTREKPLQCRYCEKTFSRASNRLNHERLVHTGERPYSCVQCNQAFVDRTFYNAHMKKFHPGMPLMYRRKADLLEAQRLAAIQGLQGGLG